jgi:hypothetical protein
MQGGELCFSNRRDFDQKVWTNFPKTFSKQDQKHCPFLSPPAISRTNAQSLFQCSSKTIAPSIHQAQS